MQNHYSLAEKSRAAKYAVIDFDAAVFFLFWSVVRRQKNGREFSSQLLIPFFLPLIEFSYIHFSYYILIFVNFAVMGREKSHDREDVTEVDVVDRGIHTFSQLNLNCMFIKELFIIRETKIYALK